jgi:vacuolar protein sorting-associated protein 13B
MFKLESYITPIILSYVDKYVKNARADRSQVSLWGGDVVFSNLDLRLDVLEKELGLPFTFVSGHIHELHINVPWTRLNAEPIVITINTIECVLRLPDSSNSSQDGSEASAKSSATDKKRSSRRSPAKQQGTIHILRKHLYSTKLSLTLV